MSSMPTSIIQSSGATPHSTVARETDTSSEATALAQAQPPSTTASAPPNAPPTRPALHILTGQQAPVTSVSARSTPRRSQTLPVGTSDSLLHPLPEHEQVETVLPPSAPCRNVWLCSPPPKVAASLPNSPIGLNTGNPLIGARSPRSASAVDGGSGCPSAAVQRCRPFITRALSTGRLAQEFDNEGRVVCLSTHSERVLQANVLSSPTNPIAGPRSKAGSPPSPPSRSSPISSAGPWRRATPSKATLEKVKGDYVQLQAAKKENVVPQKAQGGKAEGKAPKSRPSLSPGFGKVRDWLRV